MPYDKTLSRPPYLRKSIQFFPSLLINEDYALKNTSKYKLRFIIEQIIPSKILDNFPSDKKDIIDKVTKEKVFTIVNIVPLIGKSIMNLDDEPQIIALRKFFSTLCKALQDRNIIPAIAKVRRKY